jgi:hypothetical protein
MGTPLHPAGETPLPTFGCTSCGYIADPRQAPQRCPMCGDESWTQDTRGIADLHSDLDPLTRARAADNDIPLRRDVDETSIFPGVPLS